MVKYQHLMAKYLHLMLKYQHLMVKYLHLMVKYQHLIVKYLHLIVGHLMLVVLTLIPHHMLSECAHTSTTACTLHALIQVQLRARYKFCMQHRY